MDDMATELLAKPLNSTSTIVHFEGVYLPIQKQTNTTKPRCPAALIAKETCPIDAPFTVTYRVGTMRDKYCVYESLLAAAICWQLGLQGTFVWTLWYADSCELISLQHSAMQV